MSKLIHLNEIKGTVRVSLQVHTYSAHDQIFSQMALFVLVTL